MEYAIPLNKQPVIETTPITALQSTETVISKSVIEIESLEHRNEMINSNNIVVIKYSADWCGPCKKIAPSYHEMANLDTDGIIYCEEDIDSDYGDNGEQINSIPAFHIYVNGKFSTSTKGANLDLVKTALNIIKNK